MSRQADDLRDLFTAASAPAPAAATGRAHVPRIEKPSPKSATRTPKARQSRTRDRDLLVIHEPTAATGNRPLVTGCLVHTIAWDSYQDLGMTLGLDEIVRAILVESDHPLTPSRIAQLLLESGGLPPRFAAMKRNTLRHHVNRALQRLCESGQATALAERISTPGRPGIWYEIAHG